MEKKQQNHLMYLVIAIIVIVLITILVIVAINNKNGGLNSSDNIPPEESKFEVTSGEIETYDSFIKVKRIMNKVVSYVKEANEGKTENFYNCLDKQYISEEGITETDLKDSLKGFNNDVFKKADVPKAHIAAAVSHQADQRQSGPSVENVVQLFHADRCRDLIGKGVLNVRLPSPVKKGRRTEGRKAVCGPVFIEDLRVGREERTRKAGQQKQQQERHGYDLYGPGFDEITRPFHIPRSCPPRRAPRRPRRSR